MHSKRYNMKRTAMSIHFDTLHLSVENIKHGMQHKADRATDDYGEARRFGPVDILVLWRFGPPFRSRCRFSPWTIRFHRFSQ